MKIPGINHLRLLALNPLLPLLSLTPGAVAISTGTIM
jgi:hypothetical protein